MLDFYSDAFTFDDLVELMAFLRAPGGCPWDAAQSHESIRRNFIEEVYEAVEAIDNKDVPLLKEELGDVCCRWCFTPRSVPKPESLIWAMSVPAS